MSRACEREAAPQGGVATRRPHCQQSAWPQGWLCSSPLPASGGPWPVAVSLQSLPLVSAWPTPLSSPLSPVRTLTIDLGSPLNLIPCSEVSNPGRPHLKILNLIATTKTLLPKKVTFLVLRIWR